ncbi:hypothetical protein GcC1_191029 [Golovinomyces cichoracearum]|uniref:MULE transposase domain-containing protein n=1 Tax=Golovinomyces cichoracearum TaxID=62708 RepID=A0A420HIG3_9PEZI|nr:hypothetical protein GcC1_191029 [Golovinomyces cichoracearum]
MNTSSRAHQAHRAAALPKKLREEILLSSKAGLSIGQNMSAFRAKQKRLGGMSPLQWLLQELQACGFNPKYETNDDNSLTKLMYLHPQSLLLWKNNPDILLINCTYKTNRLIMPLLNNCGVTGGNKVIQLGLVFLFGGKESDYDWVLVHLKEIMAIEGISFPISIVTDRGLALMKSLDFNRSQNLVVNVRINIIDPRVIPTRGRPRGALGGLSTETESSTRRHPSQFEHTIQEECREAFRVRGHDQGQNQALPGRLKVKRGENADNNENSHSKTRIPLHNRVSRSSAALGISRLETHGDLHEPEITSERSSGKVLSKIWRDRQIEQLEVKSATLCTFRTKV